MEVQQQFRVAAGADRVLRVLLDIPAVAGCIPGVEEFRAAGTKTYEGRIRLKVGPLSTNFKGRITVTEADETARLAAFVAEASDTAIGSTVKMRQSFRLTPAADGGTDVSVTAEVDVRGRLAQLGWGLIKPKVTSTMQEFAANLKALCEAGGKSAGPGSAAG